MQILSVILFFLASQCDGSFIPRPSGDVKWTTPAALMSQAGKTAGDEAPYHTEDQISTSSDAGETQNWASLSHSNDLLLTKASSEVPKSAQAFHLRTDLSEPPYSKPNPGDSRRTIPRQSKPSSLHNRPQNAGRQLLQHRATRTGLRSAGSDVNQYINWQHPQLKDYKGFQGKLSSLTSAVLNPDHSELEQDPAVSGLINRITQSGADTSDVIRALSEYHQMRKESSQSTSEEEFSEAMYSRRDGEPYTPPSYSHSGPPVGAPEHRFLEKEPEDNKNKVMTKIATIGLWGALAAGTISLGLFRGRSLEPGLFNYLWEAGKLGLRPEEENLDNIYETLLKGADADDSGTSDVEMERHQVDSYSNQSHLVVEPQEAGNLTSSGNLTERGDWLPVVPNAPSIHLNVTRSQTTGPLEDKNHGVQNGSSNVHLTQASITEEPEENPPSESNQRSYHEWTSADQREDSTGVRVEHRHRRQVRTPYAAQRRRAYGSAPDRRLDARFGNSFSGSFENRNQDPYEVVYEDPYNTKRPSKGSFFDISLSDITGLLSTSFVLGALGLSFYLGVATPYATTSVVTNTTTNGTNVSTNAQITTSGTDTVTVTNMDTDTLTNSAPASITNTPSNTNTQMLTDSETITSTVTDSSTITNNRGTITNTNTNNG